MNIRTAKNGKKTATISVTLPEALFTPLSDLRWSERKEKITDVIEDAVREYLTSRGIEISEDADLVSLPGNGKGRGKAKGPKDDDEDAPASPEASTDETLPAVTPPQP